MKSRKSTCITAIALFTALAMPVRLAAQNSPSQDHKLKHHTYRLVDIGTLGGPHSEVNGGPPPMINNAGVVAGLADTSARCPYLDGFLSPAFKWQKGVLINMGCFRAAVSAFPTRSIPAG